MLRITILAAVLLTICAPVFGQEKSKLSYRFDAFKGETSVATPEMTVASTPGVRISLIASFAYPGERYRKPETVTLLFIALADNWLFLEPPTVRAIIVDKSGRSERLSLGDARVVTAKVIVGQYVKTREVLNVQVPVDDFLRLSSGGVIALQLRSGVEFALKDDHVKQMASLARELRN